MKFGFFYPQTTGEKNIKIRDGQCNFAKKWQTRYGITPIGIQKCREIGSTVVTLQP
jgi:hypothetical protein